MEVCWSVALCCRQDSAQSRREDALGPTAAWRGHLMVTLALSYSPASCPHIKSALSSSSPWPAVFRDPTLQLTALFLSLSAVPEGLFTLSDLGRNIWKRLLSGIRKHHLICCVLDMRCDRTVWLAEMRIWCDDTTDSSRTTRTAIEITCFNWHFSVVPLQFLILVDVTRQMSQCGLVQTLPEHPNFHSYAEFSSFCTRFGW